MQSICEQLGLNIKDTAALLGIDRGTLNKWLRSERTPGASARQLATLLTWMHQEHPSVFAEWKSLTLTEGTKP